MIKVTLEGVYGVREIQPESMWVGLTRGSEGCKSWSAILKRALTGFVVSENGIWLPNAEDSAQDLTSLTDHAKATEASELLLEPDEKDELVETLASIAVTNSGCWEALEEDTTSILRRFTATDTRCTILEDESNYTDVNQCGNSDCTYHRHYDLTLDVPSKRRELVYPNPVFFQQHEGRIITAWGDTLPDPEESRRTLREFQHQCLPHVGSEKSLLTLGGISQISLIPSTGCWFTRSYYMTPTNMPGYDNWQYDGYGRLKIPSERAKTVGYANYAILGHRAVWMTIGNKVRNSKKFALNHQCGFRPCANPGHLVEVTNQSNNLHGQMMDIAGKMMDGSLPIDVGKRILKARGKRQKISAADIDLFWQTHLGAKA